MTELHSAVCDCGRLMMIGEADIPICTECYRAAQEAARTVPAPAEESA